MITKNKKDMKTIDQQIEEKKEVLYRALAREQYELASDIKKDISILEDKRKTEEVRVYAL